MLTLLRILMSWIAVFVLAACSMSITGCSKDKKRSPNRDLVKYNFRIDVDTDNIRDAELQQLAKDINSGKQVSHNLVSKKFQEFHIEIATASQISNFVTKISDGLKQQNYFKRKAAYEAKIESIHNGEKLAYNKDAISVGDIVLENKMQCYSGTSLNLMVNRKVEDGLDYEANNYVAIFEAGHMLTGKMINIDNEWVLVGVESTMSGHATKMYGKASELDFSKVRVVDASLFVVTELYKDFLLSPTASARSAFEYTAKRYGINLDNISIEQAATASVVSGLKNPCDSNSPLANVQIRKDTDYSTKPINSSPMGFGCASVPDGDQERSASDGIGVDFANGNSIDVDELIKLMSESSACKPEPGMICVRRENNESISIKKYTVRIQVNEYSMSSQNFPRFFEFLLLGDKNPGEGFRYFETRVVGNLEEFHMIINDSVRYDIHTATYISPGKAEKILSHTKIRFQDEESVYNFIYSQNLMGFKLSVIEKKGTRNEKN